MDMHKCDVCGEYYSDTYRRCPFCEEEEAIRRGKNVHRRSRDFRSRRGGHAIGVLVLLLVFVAAGLTAGRFFGDKIADMVGIRTPLPPDDASQDGQMDPGGDPNGEGSTGDNDPSDDPNLTGDPDDTAPENPTEQKPDTAVVLSSADFTLSAVGAFHPLTVTGGSGSYTWTSANPAIATVGEDGKVTGVAVGNTEITVTDGYTSAVCIVRVKGTENGGDTTTSGAVKLNKEDMTMPAGTTYQLKVSGTSSTVTWAIEDTSIATIDGDGTVHFIKKGTTTATATVDGKTLKCIVRVKK